VVGGVIGAVVAGGARVVGVGELGAVVVEPLPLAVLGVVVAVGGRYT
jgi:hypothetical protein